MDKVIDSFRGEYRWLSNFWVGNPIQFLGKEYATAEHAYQASKAIHEADHEKVRLAKTPGQAKRLGRKVPVREDWDTVKYNFMSHILLEKFSDPELRKKLEDIARKRKFEKLARFVRLPNYDDLLFVWANNRLAENNYFVVPQ